jgi:hypothetical protein
MTSNHHAPYVQGYTRVTMGRYNKRLARECWQICKAALSSDRTLQLEYVKLESLVNADQHAALNTFPGLVHTARHTTKEGYTRSCIANPRGGRAPKVGLLIGVKS